MTGELLKAGERLDSLEINGFKIIQREDEFCFSLDAVLLSHFASVRPGCRAVDLGTGTGVIALLLAARGAGQVTGLEINSRMAEMAHRSVRLNGQENRIRIMEADFRRLQGLLPAGECELVVANPPYRKAGGGYLNPSGQVAMARHELTATLEQVVSAARYLLKYRGRFAMVHLPERMAEVLRCMSDNQIEPKRLRLAYPSAKRKPKFLLVEGVRGAKPGLDVLEPLFVYGSDGKYSPEILEYYRQPEAEQIDC